MNTSEEFINRNQLKYERMIQMIYSNGTTHLIKMEKDFVLIMTNKKGDVISTRTLTDNEATRMLEIHSDLKLKSKNTEEWAN